MRRLVTALVTGLGLALVSVTHAAPPKSPEERAAELVAQMTLDEKSSRTRRNYPGPMQYRNRPGNTQQTHDVRVFHVAVPLQQGRTVTGVILPNVSAQATAGTPAIHVFALDVH